MQRNFNADIQPMCGGQENPETPHPANIPERRPDPAASSPPAPAAPATPAPRTAEARRAGRPVVPTATDTDITGMRMPTMQMGAMPGTYMGAVPGSHMGAMPGTHMGAMPGAHMGAMPSSHMGATPGSHMGAMPGSHMGAMPGMDMTPRVMGQMLAAPVLSPQVSSELMQLLRTMESSLPAQEVLHSLHTQVQAMPQIANLPAMKAFDQASLDHLHAFIATGGYIRRIISGDRTDSTKAAFRRELEKMTRSYGEAMEAFDQVLTAPAARANPLIVQMNQVLQMVSSTADAIEPMITQLMRALRPAH